MLSRELEETLRRAMSNAASRSHEFATLEHLLVALTEDSDACEVLKACNVDISALLDKLHEYIEVELASIVSHTDELEVQPTASFQRVIQRAIIHTQSSGREVATGANVLVSIFSERESHAVWFLKSQNMTRLDAVSFISHGNGNHVARGSEDPIDSDGTEGDGKDPLTQYAVNLIAKAAAGRIDPLIGRDRELDRTIQVLCRRFMSVIQASEKLPLLRVWLCVFTRVMCQMYWQRLLFTLSIWASSWLALVIVVTLKNG